MGAGHSHTHDLDGEHGFVSGWQGWAQDRTLQLVTALIALAAVATVIGVIALWPSGDGQEEAVANANEIGLGSQRLSATVSSVVRGPCSYSTSDRPQDCLVLTFELNEGRAAGDQINLPEINLTFDTGVPEFTVGDDIIVGYEESTDFYFYADQDRRTPLVVLAIAFALVVIALGRVRGVLALVAMAMTLVVLVGFIAPSVLDGNDPLLVAVVAAAAIAFVSLYLTHGFTPTTTVALAGTLGALGLTLGLSWIFFEVAQFTGLATEEALLLPFLAEDLNVSGLLLGGAIIGALGALDDVTVTQVATVAELRYRSPTLPNSELIASGIRVGRDHIASTVNTLLLAYAGASLPLILLFAVADQPLQMVANSELIAVEIVRTLCGSIGLVAAVPITTLLAAALMRPQPASDEVEPPLDEPASDEPGSDKSASDESGSDESVSDEPTPVDNALEDEMFADAEDPMQRAPQWADFAPEADEI